MLRTDWIGTGGVGGVLPTDWIGTGGVLIGLTDDVGAALRAFIIANAVAQSNGRGAPNKSCRLGGFPL